MVVVAPASPSWTRKNGDSTPSFSPISCMIRTCWYCGIDSKRLRGDACAVEAGTGTAAAPPSVTRSS